MNKYMIDFYKDEQELATKNLKKYNNKKLQLYLEVTNGLVDGFTFSELRDTMIIGNVEINLDNFNQIISIDNTTDAGKIAISLLDELKEKDLFTDQTYISYNLHPNNDSMCGILRIKIGVLGKLQEDLYSVYFTGKSMRDYGKKKASEVANGEDNDSSNISNESVFTKIFKKIFKKKGNQ